MVFGVVCNIDVASGNYHQKISVYILGTSKCEMPLGVANPADRNECGALAS